MNELLRKQTTDKAYTDRTKLELKSRIEILKKLAGILNIVSKRNNIVC